ncbi:MAG: hypothetical protein ABI876_06080, partial [Bacteroidota bacterium]
METVFVFAVSKLRKLFPGASIASGSALLQVIHGDVRLPRKQRSLFPGSFDIMGRRSMPLSS